MIRHSSTSFVRKFLTPLEATQQDQLNLLASKDLSQFNEQDVREEFLAPLIHLLGYGRGTEYDVKRGEDYPLAPVFVQVGRQRIELDYQFLVYKRGFWLLEAKPAKCSNSKSPPVPTEQDIGQAFFYALNPKIDTPYFAVSNGWHFWLFDRDLEDPIQPILKVKQGELPAKFDEIRRFVAADQIVFNVKERLLGRIEQVLSADCYPERTGQFVECVARIGDKVQPQVFDNFRIARKEQSAEDLWKQTLDRLDLDQLAGFPMEYPRSLGEIKAVSDAVASRLLASCDSSLFYSRLCLEEARSVPTTYYLSSLYTLGSIALKNKREAPWTPPELRHRPRNAPSYVDLFNWWAGLLLTRFHHPARPALRMIWLLEALVGRVTKRLLIYGVEQRKDIIQAVNLQRFLLPEEALSWLVPCPAKQVSLIVEIAKHKSCGIFFRRHFNPASRAWNNILAMQHYQQYLEFENKLINATPDYEALKRELGTDWSDLMFIDSVNKDWDQLGAGICDVLREFPTLLQTLPSELKSMIQELAELGTNYAADCCNSLQLPFIERSVEERVAGMQKFFAP